MLPNILQCAGQPRNEDFSGPKCWWYRGWRTLAQAKLKGCCFEFILCTRWVTYTAGEGVISLYFHPRHIGWHPTEPLPHFDLKPILIWVLHRKFTWWDTLRSYHQGHQFDVSLYVWEPVMFSWRKLCDLKLPFWKISLKKKNFKKLAEAQNILHLFSHQLLTGICEVRHTRVEGSSRAQNDQCGPCPRGSEDLRPGIRELFP